jgi:hypothetical protein
MELERVLAYGVAFNAPIVKPPTAKPPAKKR